MQKAEGGQRTRDRRRSAPSDSSLVSIITVVRDRESVIGQTIRSVIEQEYPNIEYIVVDGGSTDGTLEVLRKYEDEIDYWVSEPDFGVYDAMNKGISLATGRGLLFMNAGDYFVGSVLTTSLSIPGFLRVCYKDRTGKMKEQAPKDYRRGMPICHQGVIFENLGLAYDLGYRISSDYDFYLRHGYRNLPSIESPGYVYYDNQGMSHRNAGLRDREIIRIVCKNFGPVQAAAFSWTACIKAVARTLLVR